MQVGTYMRKIAAKLVAEAVYETREQTSTACDDHVAHEDLTQLGIARAERVADESWDAFR